MPTGYTAGILDGNIKSFPEFAKVCMRAFGATVHMRDDSLSEEYTPRVLNDYHIKEINRARKSLKKAETLSDEKIISKEKKRLLEMEKTYTKSISNAKTNRIKLDNILSQILKWNPPTTNHNEFKKFMIGQINSTIDFDCKTYWQEEKLADIKTRLQYLNADIIREEEINQAKKDITYHLKEYQEELKGCTESNKWVEDLINSI